MRFKNILFFAGVGVMSATALTGCGKKTKKDEYDSKGRLIITMRNLYFDDYQGGDYYIRHIQNEYGVNIKFQSYSWNNWSTQVTGQVNGGNLPDTFHADINSYNFAHSYKFWAQEHIIKPLPEDLSQWPNIQAMLDNISNIDALKINGKLYGLPIAKKTTDYQQTFSPFTYIYRRDWAKEWGVYQENDEYTWTQFMDLLTVFKNHLPASQKKYALGDVEWGFPSITNFYKQVPHCFAFDSGVGDHGKYVNNYTTDAYIEGMKKARELMDNGIHLQSQNQKGDGDTNKDYYSNRIGVFYENLSYENYIKLKKNLKVTNASDSSFDVEDAVAIMKVKGPDGKYALEGTDNWFSMTFFDNQISKKKQEKILDILDWLLSEDGTMYAIYGEEDYDYEYVEVYNPETGEMEEKFQLIESNWPKTSTGEYARKDNGAKFLRYLVSLGYDTLSYDPLTDKKAVSVLETWEQEMLDAYVPDNPATADVNEYETESTLKILKENAEVMWLTTEKKASYSGQLRESALETVMNYVYRSGVYDSNYKSQFNNEYWRDVLAEINRKLGYN